MAKKATVIAVVNQKGGTGYAKLRIKSGKPFPQEAELAAKSKRLAELDAELDAELNMEGTVENREERRETERPSVLADLKSKAETISPAKCSEDYEEVL